jgi:CheY-like chemotaxis protein
MNSTRIPSELREMPGLHAFPSTETRPVVFIADHRAHHRRLLARILEREGCEVHQVSGGDEALERIDCIAFDVAFINLALPGVDGISLAKLLAFAHLAEQMPALVAILDDRRETGRPELDSAGFSHHLQPPIRQDEVVGIVRDIVRRRAAERKPGRPEKRRHCEAATPVLESSRFDSIKRLDDDDGFVAGLIDDFISDADELIRSVETAHEEARGSAMRELLTELHGCAANLGAVALTDLCRRYEDHAQSLDSRQIGQLRQTYETLKSQLLIERSALERSVRQ